MNTEKISVIIPVYNVEKYISVCLDSVLAQSYKNIEVICIDDGSTDASGEICDHYAKIDNRVKVHHIINGGVSNARNYGLSILTGEWFAFIDADDWIDYNYFEILYNKAIEYDCDISACGFQRNTQNIYHKEEGEANWSAKTVLFYSSEECIHSFICSNNSLQGMSTNKLYRTRLFGHIEFDEKIKVNEDCLFTYKVMQLCNRACLTNAPMYHWYTRTDSACHSKTVSADFTAANVFYYLYLDTKKYKDNEVSTKLKMNYVTSVLKVLMYADYSEKDTDIVKAKQRCRTWKSDVWRFFNVKVKIKYYIAFYLPGIARLVK